MKTEKQHIHEDEINDVCYKNIFMHCDKIGFTRKVPACFYVDDLTMSPFQYKDAVLAA